MEITEKELLVLKAITESEFHDSEGDFVWDFSVFDSLDFDGLKGKTRSGVFSSLVSKGLIEIYDKVPRTDKYWSSEDPGCLYDEIGVTSKGYELLKKI